MVGLPRFTGQEAKTEMKKVDKKNMEGVFGKLLIFVAFSVGIIIASYVISIFCVTASMSEIKPFSEIIFYIGNWPSIVLKVYPTITDPNGIVVLDGEKA